MITLITSAAFVDAELEAEFGKLPPAFLPLGTKRLFEHQVAAIKNVGASKVYLSLPISYNVSPKDAQLLRENDVTVIAAPDGLSLGYSIKYCLSVIEDESELHVIHGDTLHTPDIQLQTDTWATSEPKSGYNWGHVYVKQGHILGVGRRPEHDMFDAKPNVLVGSFKFSDSKLLGDCLELSNGDFLTALSRYSLERKVKTATGGAWLDFGHLQTYFHARSRYAAARSFNELEISNGFVTKRSEQDTKIAAEAHWLTKLPVDLTKYAARVVSHGNENGTQYYKTEYEFLPTLQEIFVFGELNPGHWEVILSGCLNCLSDFASTSIVEDEKNNKALLLLAGDKTHNRLDEFQKNASFSLESNSLLNGQKLPSVRQIAEEMVEVISTSSPLAPSIMHGDFCFSNILFNSRTQRVRIIDPRGTIDGKSSTLAGDQRYDMAKFMHSIFGRYDLIIAGRFDLETHFGLHDNEFHFSIPPVSISNWLEETIIRQKVKAVNFNSDAVLATLVSLFLSMLPLHADKPRRQLAMLANALRLYQDFFGGKK